MNNNFVSRESVDSQSPMLYSQRRVLQLDSARKRVSYPRNAGTFLVAVILAIVATVATAQAEPRQSTKHNRNYILRRQEAGLVSGVPTTRRIIGKREIDVYPNGLMFEGDHVVGVRNTR